MKSVKAWLWGGGGDAASEADGAPRAPDPFGVTPSLPKDQHEQVAVRPHKRRKRHVPAAAAVLPTTIICDEVYEFYCVSLLPVLAHAPRGDADFVSWFAGVGGGNGGAGFWEGVAAEARAQFVELLLEHGTPVLETAAEEAEARLVAGHQFGRYLHLEFETKALVLIHWSHFHDCVI